MEISVHGEKKLSSLNRANNFFFKRVGIKNTKGTEAHKSVIIVITIIRLIQTMHVS